MINALKTPVTVFSLAVSSAVKFSFKVKVLVGVIACFIWCHIQRYFNFFLYIIVQKEMHFSATITDPEFVFFQARNLSSVHTASMPQLKTPP